MVETHALGLATFGGVQLELDLFATRIAADHLRAELEVDALLLQELQRGFGDFRVHARAADLVQEFHHRHLGAESRPHRAHLEADDAATDDHQRLGYLFQG